MTQFQRGEHRQGVALNTVNLCWPQRRSVDNLRPCAVTETADTSAHKRHSFRVSWTGKKKRKKKDGSKPDYYKLLGLQNERWMATEADIKLGAPTATCCRLFCRQCAVSLTVTL